MSMREKGMNRKRKFKIIWLHEWHIEEQEAWFMDMAKQGWQLENLVLWGAIFVEALPEEIGYRIEITKKNQEIEEERIQLYDDAGWDYVTSRRFVHVFRKRKEKQAVEIHTDPVLQAESIKILKKSMWSNSIAFFLLTIFIFSLRLIMFNHLTSYDLLSNQIITDALFTLFYFYLVYYFISGIIHITSLIKKLQKGIGLQRNHKYKQKIKFGRFSFFLLSVCAIVLIVLGAPKLNPNKMYPKIPAGELPVISLADIENVDLTKVTYENNGMVGKRDNHFVKESSILVPKQFILHQQFFIPGETWNNSKEKYQPAIQSKKYEALTREIAEKLLNLLLEEHDYKSSKFTEHQVAGYDEVWIEENTLSAIIIAREEKNVYVIYYDGNQSIEQLKEKVFDQ